MTTANNWIVVFRDTHEETGADSVGVSVVDFDLEPGVSVVIDGALWTHFGVYMSREQAEKKAKSMTVKNNNYARGFGPTPVRFVGLMLGARCA